MGCSLFSFQLQKMKEKKGLYPDKSVYTQQIGPGFCFGALALMLRFFFEVPVCARNPSDFTRCKGCYQDRRPPPSHRRAASSLGQKPSSEAGLWAWLAGVWWQGQGLVPIPAPGPLTASDAQGDACPLSPPLSESQGQRPRFLQPHVVLKMALSNASGVFLETGRG